MRLRLKHPTREELGDLADEQSRLDLGYEPAGLTGDDAPGVPARMRRQRWERTVGVGRDDFDRAVAFIRSWGLQTGSGIVVAAPGPVEPGMVVAMSAPLPVGWIDLACRVIAVDEGTDDWSFTYGTLPEHPEVGEERFRVLLDESGDVNAEIVAVSRPGNSLARLAPPIARVLQRKAVGRYFDALERALQSPTSSD